MLKPATTNLMREDLQEIYLFVEFLISPLRTITGTESNLEEAKGLSLETIK